jgi:hypothetical protein
MGAVPIGAGMSHIQSFSPARGTGSTDATNGIKESPSKANASDPQLGVRAFKNFLNGGTSFTITAR